MTERLNCVNIRLEGRTQKEYKQCNKDKIEEYQKKYYKDTLSVKHECQCGSIVSFGKRRRHEKSIKHQKFIEQNN